MDNEPTLILFFGSISQCRARKTLLLQSSRIVDKNLQTMQQKAWSCYCGCISNLKESTMAYLYLTIAIVAEVVATNALKASEEFTKLVPSIVVVVGYGAAF